MDVNNNEDSISGTFNITGAYSELGVSSTNTFEAAIRAKDQVTPEAMLEEDADDLYLFIESSLHDFESLSSHDSTYNWTMDLADFQSMLDDIISDTSLQLDKDSVSAKTDFENVIQDMYEESCGLFTQ